MSGVHVYEDHPNKVVVQEDAPTTVEIYLDSPNNVVIHEDAQTTIEVFTGGQPIILGTASGNDTEDFATAAQGDLADTALQPSDIGTTVQAYDADLATLAAANNGAVLAATTASFLIADETKLDGIEAGATADQTAADIRGLGFFDTTNDGTGSGLDADLLDGLEATAFATAAQGATADSALQPADIGVTVQGYDAVLAGTTASFTVADETKLDGIEAGATADQTAADIRGLGFFDVTNDGAGSLLDADLLDGLEATAFATAAQGTTADSALQPTDIGVSVQGYDAVLAATTASFTIADETKLDGIEAGATADQVASDVPVTPTGNLGSSDVQAALQELQGDIDNLSVLSAPDNLIMDNFGGFVPGNGVGNDGDYAVDISDGSVYGPKAAGVWPSTPVGDFIVATNLGTEVDGESVTITSSNGLGTTILAATLSAAGVMAAVDKIKLDTIEAGATADQTAADIRGLGFFDVTNDGAGSLLDADLLDGLEATAFATAAQGSTADTALQPGDVGVTVQAYDAVLAATTASFTIADETKLDGIEAGATADQTAADIRGLGFFDVTNDGTGSGLDADLLDGLEATAFATAAQGALADTALQPGDLGAALLGGDIGVLVQAWDADLDALAAANNSTVLAATTASFLLADETKLDGIEAGATADQIASEVPVTPSGNLSSSDVQAALQELQGDIDTLTTLGAPDNVVMDNFLGAAPTNGVGNDGDYAIDISDGSVYGPKAGGVWPGAPIGDFIVATNLGNTRDAISVTITSSDGTDTTISAADGSNAGVLSSADKIKLDGIEAGATADQTAADIRGLGFFDTTNDGTGSGLDADLLDGLEATAFATAAQGTTADSALQPADIGVTVQGYDADLAALAAADNGAVLAATTASFTIADETKLDGIEAGATADQTAADIRGLGFFDTTNDGAGSLLDADLLDGLEATAFATAAQGATADTALQSADIGVTVQAYDADLGTIAAANNGAVLAATTASFLIADETKLDGIEAGATADQTAADIRGLGFFDTTNDGTGSGLDADLLDGLEATAFATAAQGATADTALQPADIGVTVQAYDADLATLAAANNGAVLAATTASFLIADETKLDGIEAGATADQTAADIRGLGFFDITNDGTGSLLDADLLDGLEATAFATAAQGATADSALQPADIGVSVVGYDADEVLLAAANADLLIGSSLDDVDQQITSNGTIITFSAEKDGGGDVRVVFSTGTYVWDTSPAATVALTAGTDTSPVLNYVYLLESTKVLTASTAGWPAGVEHMRLATVIVQSAATVQTFGPLKHHAWTDHQASIVGHLAHLNEWIRRQDASWISGVALTPTVGVSTFDVATTTGVVLQLHRHSFPTFDTSAASEVSIVNHPTTPYLRVGDLTGLTVDADNEALAEYYSLVFWGVVAENDTDAKLMVNLPTGSYVSNAGGQAANDDKRTAVYTFPDEYTGTAFLIARVVVRQVGSTFTLVENRDLRGAAPSRIAGEDSGGVYNNALLESALSTGLVSGGVLSVGTGGPGVATTFSVSDGYGYVVDNSTPNEPALSRVEWTGLTDIAVTNIGANPISWVSINSAGAVVQQIVPFSQLQYRDNIILGVIVHVNFANVNAVNNQQHYVSNPYSTTADIFDALGFINYSGNLFSGNPGAGLNLQKTAGVFFAHGANYFNDPKNPNFLAIPSTGTGVGDPSIFQYRLSNGQYGTGPDAPYSLLTNQLVDPTRYESSSGVLSTVQANRWTVQRIYLFQSEAIKLQYGQYQYTTPEEAIAAIATENFTTEASFAANGLLRGFLVVKETCTDLTDTATTRFVAANKFGSAGGESGGLGGGGITQFDDNVFRIFDNLDPTKLIAVQASNVGTGTLRTITMPNADVNLGLVNTALQTAADVRGIGFFDITNDGTGSGLDADLLDGLEATAFATAAQGSTADTALQPADIGVSVQGYDAVLAATTASFTTADETKLDGIEAGATADQIASEVPVTPSGNLSSSDVQAALQELQGDIDTLTTLGAPDNVIMDNFLGAAPANGVGNDGDYAIDISDGSVYGPKAAGVWPGTPIGDFIVATNLGNTRDATTVTVTSSDGADTTLLAADGSNAGVMTSADFNKLAGIEAGADVTDAANVEVAIEAITLGSVTGDTGDKVLVIDISDGGLKYVPFEEVGGGSSVNVSDTAPVGPNPGDLWFESSSGSMFVWYEDGTSSQWVEVIGQTGPQGPAPVGVLYESDVDIDIKTLVLPANVTISAFGASLIDDVDALTARSTLGLVLGTNVQAWSSVLDATTASFTIADETKLDGIEAGATADQTAADIRALGFFDTTNDGTGSLLDADLLDGLQATAFATAAQGATADTALQPAAIGVTVQAYDADLTTIAAGNNGAVLAATTASFLLADESKLDGIEAGATADQTASEILAALLTVDGAGSLLDADLLDGNNAAAFATAAQGALADTALQPAAIGVTVQAYDADLGTIAAANNGAVLAATTASFLIADESKLDGIEAGATADQTASEILTAIKTVDGAGSLLDADLLDGNEATAFATSGHDHTGVYQPSDTELTAIAGLVSAADSLPYFTGAGTASLATFTAAGRALVDDADATAQRATLGLGTAATTASTAYATAAQGTLADTALQPAAIGVTVQAYDADLGTIAAANNGAVLAATTASFLIADETKLDGIEAGADVTDAANVETAIEAITLTPITGATGDEVLVVDATDGGLKSILYEDLQPPVGGSISLVVYEAGAPISTGVKGYIEVPFACTITGWTILCDVSGSITFDIWKDTYANYPPVDADSITAAAQPSVTTANKNQSSTLTGWTTSVAAGDILGFNVDSATTVARATIVLAITKT